MQYNFTINNDKIVCDERGTPFTGNVNTYRCVFDITTTLANLVWFCVFEREGKAYVQPIVENECFIPHEVLISEGAIKIGCFATNLKEDDYKRISTNWVYFNSLEGAYTEASVPEIPEPDVWETLVLKSVPIIGENGNWYIYDMGTNSYVDTGVYADVDKKLSDSIVVAKNDISDAKENAISDIDAEKEKSTDAIIQKKDDSLKAISDAQNEVIKVIEAAENNALSDIDTEKGEAVQTITQEKEKALSGITSEKENATGAIEKEKQDAQGAVWDVRVEAIKTVETVKEEAVSDIDAEKEKAVKEVQEQTVNLATKDEVANALKETVSGEIVGMADVSPISHTVNVKVESKNVFDASKIVFANNNSKVNSDGTITAGPKEYFIMMNTKVCVLCPDLKAGDTIVISSTSPTKNVYLHGGEGLYRCGTPITVTDEILNSTMALYGIAINNPDYGQELTFAIQVEKGDTVTDYTPYVDPKTAKLTVYGTDETDRKQTFEPSSDGTYKVTSISPKMTLLTDKTGVLIEAEYNQDICAFKENVINTITQLKQAIIELGGTV